ncbi:hypothetical protein EUBSIR_01139 [[Eubacterium] siraeum DSM 15702]|uniref:Uncharacterized protein n=1 Tax=[Eubacterium] siraeum DSM 15702 TaxID=428128 RepID=B0MMQ3_9FIRM|nr:hypothetical protein EUBSIR_01139 [[Eubacterium] siraeum DSM 15702]
MANCLYIIKRNDGGYVPQCYSAGTLICLQIFLHRLSFCFYLV